MPKSSLEDLIDRLEMRRMSRADYTARWCTSCLRTELRTPFVMLHSGSDGSCHQLMEDGTISECINSFRALQREAA